VAFTSSNKKESSPATADHPAAETPRQHPGNGHLRAKDAERLRIERELQRQRMVAISGHTPKASPGSSSAGGSTAGKSGLKRELRSKPPHDKEKGVDVTHQSSQDVPEKRTVIISQRKKSHIPQDAPVSSGDMRAEYTYAGEGSGSGGPDLHPGEADARDMNIGVRDPVRRVKDDVFEGKEIRKTTAPPARDSSLIHTTLKPRKNAGLSKVDTSEAGAVDPGLESSQTPKKPEKKSQKHDDISWI
jgi:hypothetical protein